MASPPAELPEQPAEQPAEQPGADARPGTTAEALTATEYPAEDCAVCFEVLGEAGLNCLKVKVKAVKLQLFKLGRFLSCYPWKLSLSLVFSCEACPVRKIELRSCISPCLHCRMATATGILPPVQVGPWAQDLQNFADGGAGNELTISSWLSYLLEPTARPSLHCSGFLPWHIFCLFFMPFKCRYTWKDSWHSVNT